MPAVDTNVLVRLLVEDDEEQSRQAEAFVRSAGRVFVSHVVMVETAWVLTGAHGMTREQLSRALEIMLAMDSLAVERPEIVVEALKSFTNSKADFADCLIAATARAAGELPLATFDHDASRLPGARRLGKKRRR